MRLTLLVLSLLVAVGCTKQRDESFVQGQGKDLLLVSDYDGAEFDAETLELITDYKENPLTSKSEKVTENKKSAALQMGAVKVNTKADLLGDAPFIALPNNKVDYKIKYMINSDLLVVIKVADATKIHAQELPGAIKLENGKVGVPIVGYPVKGFLNPENVEQNGAKSNKLMESSVSIKAGAKYFKIDKNARVLYKLQDKLDLFAKQFFSGADGQSEWYYGQTVLAAGGRNADFATMVLGQADNELNALSKVRFVLNSSELRAISVNVDKRIDSKDEINQTVMLKIPIEWKEYRVTKSGTDSFKMEEEEIKNIDWEKRNYAKIDFAKTTTITTGGGNFRFVDLEVDTDYFSFTLYEPDANIRIKQSFLRDKNRKKYVAKRMLTKDFEKFGFFDTQKHEINNFEKYRQDDFGKNVFINRFNVAQKEIVFHFTEGSDEKLIPAAAKAAEEWSEAFAKAGVPLKITANTKDRVRLGDLRYNQINLIRSATESNLFGYGPSITDPRTGEIISATTNMHITSIVSALTSHIREYILFKSGQTKTMAVISAEPSSNDALIPKGEKLMMQNTIGQKMLLKKIPVLGLNGQLEQKEVEIVEPNQKAVLRQQKNWGREFDIGVTGKNLNAEIDHACPELASAVEALKKNSKLENENQLVIACAEKLVPHKMFGTLLHEMGHNFGLRHNFYGSVDAKNFLAKEVTKTDELVRSSSVMEYSSFGEDRLTKVGLYDIAAIRFGYGDSVESKDGAVIKLDTSKTIEENLQAKNVVAKSYMFCTDEDVAVGTDPMCARHDAGTTPDEVVDHIINEYNASISNLNYRLDRQRVYDPMRVTNYRLQRFWIPLKRYYDEWRYRLADHLGVGNEYLENFDTAKLDQAISEKAARCANQTSESADCQFVNYKKAADKIFKFSMGIATLPPKYCIGERNGKLASVEFADVRRIVVAVNKYVPTGCMDQEVKKYVEATYKFSPVSESGYELEDVRMDMKVKMSKTKTDWYGNPLPEPPDVIGLMPEKAIAMDVLAARAPLSMSATEKTFLPNFLDEPRYREVVLSYIMDRITKGVSAKKLLSSGMLEKNKDVFFEKYQYEKRFIDSMVSSVFYGLDVPGKSTASKQRKKKYLVTYTDKENILKDAKYKVAALNGTSYYAIMSNEASEAKNLLLMLESIPKRMEAASPLNDNTFKGLMEISKNNLGADGKVDPQKFVQFLYSVLEDEFAVNMKVTRTKDEKEVDRYRAHWKKVLQKETGAMREMLSAAIVGAGDDGEFDVSASLSGLATNLSNKDPKNKDAVHLKNFFPEANNLAAIYFADNYVLNQKVLEERIEAYKKVAQQDAKTAQNDDLFNYEELRTQVDLIINVLGRITDY